MLRSGIVPRALILALLVLSILAPRQAAAIVSNMTVRPTAFSPNGDGIRDHVVFRWNIVSNTAACLRLSIRNVTRHRVFELGPRPTGPDSLLWDGTDSLGVVLPDTIYGVTLEEFDTTCTNLQSNGQVTVLLDTAAPPQATYDFPDTLVTRPAFQVQGDATSADSVALFLGGVPVDTVLTTGSAPDHRYLFDVVLTEGHNSYSVQAWDKAGNFAPQTTAVDVVYQNTPDVGPMSATPSSFSPNGDGRSDSTRVKFNLDAATANLNVQVRRGEAPNGNIPDATVPVITLYDAAAPAGQQIFVWDGRDSAGVVTTDGAYVFVVQPESLAADGTPIPGFRRSYAKIVLDNTPPAAPYAQPVPAATTFRGTAELTVMTTLADSLRIFRDGTLLRVDVIEPSVSPKASVHAVPLHSGTNVITLQLVDLAGNESALGGPYTIKFETPLGFHAPEKFRKGDAFGINLSSPASSIVIDLFTLRGSPVRQLSSTSSSTHYEMPWDLKDATGQFVGDGPYLARLRVSYPNGTGQETKAAIVVVK